MTLHKLMDLPFSKDSMTSFLSPETFDFHYSKHHQTYVTKLNELLPGTEFENCSLDELVMKTTGPIFNNAAQVWNHDFYWKCLSPETQKPGNITLNLIQQTWGSFEAFRTEFETKATGLFGSGWTWLVYDSTLQKLTIVQTSNAENPMRSGQAPALTCDMWEHAYYIDYRNSRPQYLKKWWDHVNWSFVESRLTGVGK
jgi:superoxide dismutase, Fe-Mn family